MNNIDEMWKPLHEIWKPLYDYPGYMVSNLGRIKSIPSKLNQKLYFANLCAR